MLQSLDRDTGSQDDQQIHIKNDRKYLKNTENIKISRQQIYQKKWQEWIAAIIGQGHHWVTIWATFREG